MREGKQRQLVLGQAPETWGGGCLFTCLFLFPCTAVAVTAHAVCLHHLVVYADCCFLAVCLRLLLLLLLLGPWLCLVLLMLPSSA